MRLSVFCPRERRPGVARGRCSGGRPTRGPRGEAWVIECKSSRADFTSDRKWEGYLEWCDRFFWAVDDAFPTDLLPEGTGLIVADSYDAEILRMPAEAKLPGARRKVMMQKFARHAARRLQALRDPGLSLSC